jgi:hypothetical protein
MLIWDKSPFFHGGFRFVLFGDSSIKRLAEDEFQERLLRQRRGRGAGPTGK